MAIIKNVLFELRLSSFTHPILDRLPVWAGFSNRYATMKVVAVVSYQDVFWDENILYCDLLQLPLSIKI